MTTGSSMQAIAFDSAAAFTARFDVNIENPPQSLSLGHRCAAFGRRWLWRLIGRFGLFTFAPLCRCHLHTMCTNRRFRRWNVDSLASQCEPGPRRMSQTTGYIDDLLMVRYPLKRDQIMNLRGDKDVDCQRLCSPQTGGDPIPRHLSAQTP
jgi:hypothetical protein